MYQIREATRDDIPAALELIHEFQQEALDSYSLFCNDGRAVELMKAVYDNALVMEYVEDAAIQGKIVGVIAGMIGASMVSTDPVMQELIFFISKEHRKHGTELLKRFERMAKDRGCKHVLMVFMGELRREVMERYYRGQGYRLLECQYIKCLQ